MSGVLNVYVEIFDADRNEILRQESVVFDPNNRVSRHTAASAIAGFIAEDPR